MVIEPRYVPKRPPIQRDTRALLRSGAAIFATGALAAAATATIFGGIGRQGPHTNLGWLSLMLALGCLPFGLLLLALGLAKWLGSRQPPA